MNRKLIMIAAGAGLAGFAGAFATGWLTAPTAAKGSVETTATAPGQTDPSDQRAPVAAASVVPRAIDQAAAPLSMSEQQLKDLIYEVREKIQEYNRKLLDLEKEKERMQIAQQTLKKDIEALNNLRVELAASVADIKSERETLRKARLQVAEIEKANLLAIAAAYDKMDPAGASDILINMATGSNRNGTSGGGATNVDDAVKILYFMQDRTKAKVLAELVTREPALAALLCQKLKQVQEVK